MNDFGETPKPPPKYFVADCKETGENWSKAPYLDLCLTKPNDEIDLTCGTVNSPNQRVQHLTVAAPSYVDLADYYLGPTEAVTQVGEGDVIETQLRDRQIAIIGSTLGGSMLMQGAITAASLVEYCDPEQRIVCH